MDQGRGSGVGRGMGMRRAIVGGLLWEQLVTWDSRGSGESMGEHNQGLKVMNNYINKKQN